MSDEGLKCPATMCPYMDAQDGSDWTGEKDADCEEECGWYRNGGCLVAGDVATMLLEKHDEEFVMDERPPCPKSDECQWQEQCVENVCPPRLAVMLGGEGTEATF